MLLYTRLAPPKVPKRRSRAGCTYCKEKKKKCDEKRPHCSRCVERNQECTYETVKPRQRRSRESASGADGPSRLSINTSVAPLHDGARTSAAAFFSPPFSAMSAMSNVWSHDDMLFGDGGSPEAGHAELPYAQRSSDPIASVVDPALSQSMSDDVEIAFPVGRGAHPASLSGVFPIEDDVGTEDWGGAAQAGTLVRRGSGDGALGAAHASMKSPWPDLRLFSLDSFSPSLELNLPAFWEFSDRPNRRALVDHFCNVLSHLIVFREETGNPFQQLVLPLGRQNKAVMNAIYALASAHLEYRGLDPGEKSVYFHSQAIQGVKRLIEEDDKPHRNEILAAIMLLVYYEVLVQKGRCNIVDGHLKGAMTIISNPRKEHVDSTGVFLERAFRFYDVIAALSFGTAPLATEPGDGGLAPFPPLDTASFFASPLSNVDTLLGMATTLWPIIHRLSNLQTLKVEAEKAAARGNAAEAALLRKELEADSRTIERELKGWQPCLPSDFSLDDEFLDGYLSGPERDARANDRARVCSILNNALSYRHSAFVYLYRTIDEHPRSHELVQRHAHVSLTHCVATVSNAGPMGALLWPLFVAACEAISLGDRELARQAFVAIERRQGMTNIERAWAIVQEVWKRADASEDLQRVQEKRRRELELGTKQRQQQRQEQQEQQQQRQRQRQQEQREQQCHEKARRQDRDDEAASSGGSGGYGVGLGSATGPGLGFGSKGADLWRRVSREMGVAIVFG